MCIRDRVDIVDGIEHGLFAPEKVLTEGEEIYYQYCSAFPIGAMVAMTWNTELAYEMGLAAGEEMEEFQVALWLAPGMNIHRNPLCGRNFEYFSEDPLVRAVYKRQVNGRLRCSTTLAVFRQSWKRSRSICTWM